MGTGAVLLTNLNVVDTLVADLSRETRLRLHIESFHLFQPSWTIDRITEAVSRACGRIAIRQQREHSGGQVIFQIGVVFANHARQHTQSRIALVLQPR